MEDRRQHQAKRKRSRQRNKDDPLRQRPCARAQRLFGQHGQHVPVGGLQFARRDIGVERLREDRLVVDPRVYIIPDGAQQGLFGSREVDIRLEPPTVVPGHTRVMDQLAVPTDDDGEGVFGRGRQPAGELVQRDADTPGADMPIIDADGQHAPGGPIVARLVIQRALQAGAAQHPGGIFCRRGNPAEFSVLEIEFGRGCAIEGQFVGALRRVDQQVVGGRKEIEAFDIARQTIAHLPQRIEGGKDGRAAVIVRFGRGEEAANSAHLDRSSGGAAGPQIVAAMEGPVCRRDEDIAERSRAALLQLARHGGDRLFLGLGDQRDLAAERIGSGGIGDVEFAQCIGAIVVDAADIDAPGHGTDDQRDDRQRDEQASERERHRSGSRLFFHAAQRR